MPVCGDGMLKGYENCEDNDLTAGDGCATNCTVEVNWTCDG